MSHLTVFDFNQLMLLADTTEASLASRSNCWQDFRSILTDRLFFSTNVACAAPRDRDSKPSEPVPAKRSTTFAPTTSDPSQLKRVSRTESGVGRMLLDEGIFSLCPFHFPPIILSECFMSCLGARRKSLNRPTKDGQPKVASNATLFTR